MIRESGRKNFLNSKIELFKIQNRGTSPLFSEIISVVSDNPELEKNIFFLCSLPNIVDYKRYAVGCPSVGHDTDMEDTFSEIPGDEVSWIVVLRIFGDFNGRTGSLKEFHQIRNPSMVDIRIRGLHAPLPGIMRKIGFHVFVYELLKIDIEFPKRSDEDVCATTGLDRDVSPWVFQSHVGGIV
jgi:hypothetical protein